MSHATVLILALLLDAAFGDPPGLWSRLPHPAALMGRAVGWADRAFNNATRLRGALVLAGLVIVAFGAALAITAIPAGPVPEIILAAILLAQRSLSDHVLAVADALRQSPADARKSVSRIVGRDTGDMDDAAIARAAIESAAENFSDGVVAPTFWFLILGLPGLLIYKLVNTADSMIGYLAPRYRNFGWAAARFDDLLNWIPARLSAVIILAAFGCPKGWRIVRCDARLHRSPNAGWPEAAMAVCLDVALSGPRSYDGKQQDFPWVHPEGRRHICAEDVKRAVIALWRAWAVLLLLVAVLAVA